MAADRPARVKHGTVRVMATKAERRAARERVSAYHESQLAGLLGHVEAEIDRYRAGEIDAYAADETIHHYHRAAAELWKFCFARGGGAHVESIANLLDRMTADAETTDWWERAAGARCRAARQPDCSGSFAFREPSYHALSKHNATR